MLGQENTRIKIERPVLSPWLFCQHPSWPWLNHFPLLDVTTWWSWRWYLSAVCTSVLPGISPYIEPGQVYGCCFFSSGSSDLHSVLFVTLASEKKDQVHGPLHSNTYISTKYLCFWEVTHHFPDVSKLPSGRNFGYDHGQCKDNHFRARKQR